QAAVDRLRRHALGKRPPLADFQAPRRPLEALLRRLLASSGEQAPEGFPFSNSPAHSLELLDPLLDSLGLSPDEPGVGHAPLLRDWWTGTLQAASEPTVAQLRDAAASEPAVAVPRSARLPRRPEVRTAREDEDQDEDEEGLFM